MRHRSRSTHSTFFLTMLIEKVEINNIKPYEQRTFEFSSGINVLAGPNGAGKSTVFEAIGYALFGVDAQAFIGNADRFVRKGARRGRVRVHFRTDNHERYVIERRVGRQSVWRLAEKKDDGTEEVIEVKNNQELEREVRKILFQNDKTVSGKLADHFLNVIGPLQNDFLGPFVRKGQSRINDFDRILGISAWREAFNNSVELEREVKSLIAQRESVLETKQTQVTTYREVIENLDEAKQKLARKKSALTAVSAQLKHTTEQLNQSERTKTELERLDKKHDRARQQHGKLEVEKQAGERNLVAARAAKAVCQEHASAHTAYSQAEQQLKQLRQKQKQADRLQKQISKLEKQTEKQHGQIESEEKNLAEREARLRENQKDAERKLIDAQRQMQELATQGQRARADHKANKQFADRLSQLDTAAMVCAASLRLIDDLVAMKNDIADDRRSLDEKEKLEPVAAGEKSLQHKMNELMEKRATLRARKSQLEEGNQKLANRQCPFFEETCLNLEKKAQPSADFFGARIAELEEEGREISAQLEAIEDQLKHARAAQTSLGRLDQVEAQLQKATQKAGDLTDQLEAGLRPLVDGTLVQQLSQWMDTAPAGAQQAELRQVFEQHGPFDFQCHEKLGDLRSAIDDFSQRWASLITGLKEAVEARLSQLDQQVDQLRADYSAAKARIEELKKARKNHQKEEHQIAEKRKALEQQQQTLDERKREHDSLTRQARQFEDLPNRIDEQDAILVETRAGHSAYEQNRKQAEQVNQLEQEIKQIEEKLTASAQRVAEMKKELVSCRATYNEQAHQQAKDRQTELNRQQASLATGIESLETETKRLEREKARMDKVRKEIRALVSEIKQYKKTERFVHDLRSKVFNKVSEQLSERFRQEVSHTADCIYRVIAASDEELRWGPGYAIELVDYQRGNERVRSDEELSGGEMMNAVVALRLALLQTTGSKIAFFDEPTSNLDEYRRANLAQAFRSLDVGQGEVGQAWYDQLFLISHDVAFTQITDQIIHLEKGRTDEH